jgi:septum formation protein
MILQVDQHVKAFFRSILVTAATICVTGGTATASDRVDLSFELILASASPRRRELLGVLGISFRVAAADVDERAGPDELPEALVTRLAETKALTVARRAVVASHLRHGIDSRPTDPLVLAADTEVEWQGSVLGKPADAASARAMLTELRGRPHRVLTGLALAQDDRIVWSSVVQTTVWMRAYGDDEIERYVASGRPLDKAGAYGIQDGGFQPVARIEGCYTNVVGLPLCEVRRALTRSLVSGAWSLTPVRDAVDLCAALQDQAGVPGSHGAARAVDFLRSSGQA